MVRTYEQLTYGLDSGEIRELTPWIEYYLSAPGWVQEYYDDCHFGAGFRPLTTKQKRRLKRYMIRCGRALGNKVDNDIVKLLNKE